MNVFDIEKLRGELQQDLVYCTTYRQKLFIIKNYYDQLLKANNPALLEAYSIEFIEIYISVISKYSPLFLHPNITEDILRQIKLLSANVAFSQYLNLLENYSAVIRSKLDSLHNILSGRYSSTEFNKLCFPVLEIQNNTHIEIKVGLLETVTIKIGKGNKEDKFIIVPLTGNPEERLAEQINTSWQLALNYVKQQIRKVEKHHEVIISFDARLGNYIGHSLGITLTIGFIEELLKYYNAPYLVNIKSRIALTGGIDSQGKILPVGDHGIKSKIETVFFSGINTIIFPKKDERCAEEKLLHLQNEFPERVLELVAVNNLQDLLNRRNLIDIKKQNPVVRTIRSAKKNYILLILLFLLICLSSFYAIRDFDDNPAVLFRDGNLLHVKNKTGKILWSKKVLPLNMGNYLYRIVDIENDGIKEVLVTHELFDDPKESAEQGRLVCFNKNGKVIWKHWFTAQVYSKREILNNIFGQSIIIDILKEKEKNVLYLLSSHRNSFPSAIYKLDLETGEALPDTLWNAGHITSALISDYDQDGINEIVFLFFNNSIARVGIGAVQLNKIHGMAPCTDEYKLTGMDPAELEHYLLFPRTDYNKTLKYARNNGILTSLVNEGNKRFAFVTIEDSLGSAGISYNVMNNFRDIEVCISNPMRVARDTLVAHGILKMPWTDTKEYREILRSQILFWNGKEFCKITR